MHYYVLIGYENTFSEKINGIISLKYFNINWKFDTSEDIYLEYGDI